MPITLLPPDFFHDSKHNGDVPGKMQADNSKNVIFESHNSVVCTEEETTIRHGADCRHLFHGAFNLCVECPSAIKVEMCLNTDCFPFVHKGEGLWVLEEFTETAPYLHCAASWASDHIRITTPSGCHTCGARSTPLTATLRWHGYTFTTENHIRLVTSKFFIDNDKGYRFLYAKGFVARFPASPDELAYVLTGKGEIQVVVDGCDKKKLEK